MGWQKTILTFSLLLAIVSLPVYTPVCHAALILYILAWMSEGRWRVKADLLMSQPLIWAYLVFFALHLIGISYSEDATNGWFNVEKKLFLFLLPAIFATTLNLDKKAIPYLFKGFFLTCFATTLYCMIIAFYHFQTAQSQINFDYNTLSLYQQLNPGAGLPWMFFSYIELASGIGMHPTYLAMYLVFAVLLIIHLYADAFLTYPLIKKVGIILLFFYFGILIILLSSRILIIAFSIISLSSLIYFQGLVKMKALYRVASIMMMVAPIVFMLLINPVSRYRALQEPRKAETYFPSDDGVYSYSTGIRKSLWMLSLDVIKEINPVIGAGTGDVKNEIKKMSVLSGEENEIHSYDPHNQFLYTQIGLGIAGLAVLLFCFFLPCWVAIRQKNYFYMGFILLFTLVCITESALETQNGIVFFAIFNSLIVFPYSNLSKVSEKKLVYG